MAVLFEFGKGLPCRHGARTTTALSEHSVRISRTFPVLFLTFLCAFHGLFGRAYRATDC